MIRQSPVKEIVSDSDNMDGRKWQKGASRAALDVIFYEVKEWISN